VQQRTRELQASEAALKSRTKELEASNRELEAFSYSVSHDLRAPLRSLSGFSQAILEDYSNKLDSKGQEYLEHIRTSSQLMGRLIDDILTLSRVTRSSMNREKVNLSKLAEQVADELKRGQPGRAVEFRIKPDIEGYGDENLLKLVLDNLMGNAFKFTAKTDHPTIEFGHTEENGEGIYFVKDNGAGFDMQYANKLFTPFQRLHSEAEFPGTGIGLASVQRIIHRHGGRVWAEGKVGKGASFYFTLG
jgi:light-regulated signal transduction histidine kinase (bacteriophytochrome)